MNKIIPKFEFDRFGRVLCQAHQDYPKFFEYGLTLMSSSQSKRLFSCKTCLNYKNDRCKYSKKELRGILWRFKLCLYRCELCGANLDRMFNILYNRTVDASNFNVKIASICCDCINALSQEDALEVFKSRKKLTFILGSTFLLMAITFLVLFSVLISTLFYIFIMYAIPLLMFLPIGSLFYQYIRLSHSLKNSPLLQHLIKIFDELRRKKDENSRN
ncbi:MAG: hypothetical protein ACFFBC_03975 [Promethearchaeota archaeon]